MVERKETAFELLVSHEEFAEPIEPTMANLDNPAARLLLRITSLVVGLFAPINHMRDVAMLGNDLGSGLATVSRVCAQVFAALFGRRLALDHDRFQHLVNLAALFLPDLLDWGQQPLAPRGP